MLSSISYDQPCRLDILRDLSFCCNTFQHKAFPYEIMKFNQTSLLLEGDFYLRKI